MSSMPGSTHLPVASRTRGQSVSSRACNAVFVGGRAVFLDGTATELVGKQRTGRFLRAAHKAPAVTVAGR